MTDDDKKLDDRIKLFGKDIYDEIARLLKNKETQERGWELAVRHHRNAQMGPVDIGGKMYQVRSGIVTQEHRVRGLPYGFSIQFIYGGWTKVWRAEHEGMKVYGDTPQEAWSDLREALKCEARSLRSAADNLEEAVSRMGDE